MIIHIDTRNPKMSIAHWEDSVGLGEMELAAAIFDDLCVSIVKQKNTKATIRQVNKPIPVNQ